MRMLLAAEPNQAFNSSDEDDANDKVEAENTASNDFSIKVA